ncbi:FAD-dependent thymidylate synthase [Brevibacillus panacihumi]|uniref:FAD-dependent thymidylate synthase n=1 Tax=Brevibacillus panacihumi TaxID=497735 RepID=UPI003D08188B
MSIKLLAHTQLSDEFLDSIDYDTLMSGAGTATSGQAVALTAIRTCYSATKPSEIVAAEGERYFGQSASDGEGGTEADRLFRHITRSGHLSTLEHVSYTFAIEGVSRALLAQLTRHRVGFSFSVQSQRYVRMGSGDKSGGFDYVVPPSIRDKGPGAIAVFKASMGALQQDYDALRLLGVPAEDARMVLPNAAATNLTMTANLRALLDFYGKRRKGRGAQHEITELAERLREEVTRVDPWTAPYFDAV